MTNAAYRFNVGAFHCLALRDNDWNTVLFVDTGQQRLLIDTGCGPTLTPPGQVLEQLQAAGVAPAAVDIVILSHADCDHIGGATTASGILAFPNARYLISQAEWAYRETQPVRLRRELNTFLDEAFFQWSLDTPVLRWAQLRHQLEVIDPAAEIVPGVKALALPGHTPGMLGLTFSSGTERLLYAADVLHGADLTGDPASYRIAAADAWHAFIDVDPLQAFATREQLLALAAQHRTLLMLPHFPFHGLGYVASDEQGWRWQPHHTAG